MNNKIIRINKINFLNKLRKKKKLVLCHGVFDLLHLGHIEHFKSAKKYGDILIVSVTHDKFINKGPGKPVFNQAQRMEYLSNIDLVDYVCPSNSASSLDVINLIKPHVYVKGPDYKKISDDKTKKIILERAAVKKNKGVIKYTDDFTFSSSSILNSSNLIFSDNQKEFVEKIKKNHSVKKIFNTIESFKKLHVCVMGELIFDKYIFGNIIGKSGKEPHLVFENKYEEIYIGGTGAIVRHIMSMVKKIEHLTLFGNEKNLVQKYHQSMSKLVNTFNVFNNKKIKSIQKSRFVDLNSGYKMFGSYILPSETNFNHYKNLINKIKKIVDRIDLFIIADYGHNFFNKETVDFIKRKGKKISINCQVNASSIKNHSFKIYKNSYTTIINESELRYEEKDQISSIEKVMLNFNKKNNFKNLIITRGKNGSIYLKDKKFFYCPGFAIKSVDKVGAGDTMLAICSLAIIRKQHPEVVLFLGSLAASISIQSHGNKENVNIDLLLRIVEYILK